MEYNFNTIEQKWQQRWNDSNAYQVTHESSKPKYYVLDMFPYPSGAGLHVGHPLGYIASDILARYKRLKGFNVLHPMGYDAFGLPAEQYAIEHGVHPATSTENNIRNFRRQLDKIGFCYDWSREVRTCDAGYYKWTQWIFLQLYHSFYNRLTNLTEPVEKLIAVFEQEGNLNHSVPDSNYTTQQFSANEWNAFDEKKREDILMQYRIAFCGYGEVNWCEALGTVLANDEVVNGVSERGGHPVEKRKLRQWYLRITEFAERLLLGLNRIDFSESMKEMQTNWIGRSVGAEIDFEIRLTPNPSPHGEEGSTNPLSAHYFQTTTKSYWNILKEFSRTNRKKATEAEDALWQKIRNNALGVNVRRQHAIQTVIVDFAITELNLIIEIDDSYHDEVEQKKYDEARTAFLNDLQLKEIRFTNEQVLNNITDVVAAIKKEMSAQKIKLEQVSQEQTTEQAFINKEMETNDCPPLLREEKGTGDEALLPEDKSTQLFLKVYTTRPDTIFGADFMVIAPEHELISTITTPEQQKEVEHYLHYVKSRSERERMAEKKISGVFTGAYCKNPFDNRLIPIWISEYVLAGYGTGAIMAVPCGDERDFKFARHFNIPITNIIGAAYNGEEANSTKEAVLENSGFINGLVMKDAMQVVVDRLEELGIGKKKINYKMRDAAFSRQRYWGEPFPVIWKDATAFTLDASELPVLLPEMTEIKTGKNAEGPLSLLDDWKHYKDGIREVNTMPGYAGSSWYFLRYMDPTNTEAFCSRNASDYWGQVDLYIGGTEHAVGHLLYSRMWTKALFDLGHIGFDEPFKKLLNQGMIQGSSRFVYRVRGRNEFVSAGLIDKYETDALHVDVNFVDGTVLDIEAFKQWRNAEFADSNFMLEEGKYICGVETEKMSKSKFNTVNPDDLVLKYGADTFRMYEMFLGPIDQSKPWETKGIEGVHRFIKKLWRLFYDEVKGPLWKNEVPTSAELKVLHKAIRKIEEDTERFSFNTAVSAFMVCVNELSDLKCHKKEILESLLILLTPYAPHICEELWEALGNQGFVIDAAYPIYNASYTAESVKEYPVSINGKMRTTIQLPVDITEDAARDAVLSNDVVGKWVTGKEIKKFIFVKGRMINLVIV